MSVIVGRIVGMREVIKRRMKTYNFSEQFSFVYLFKRALLLVSLAADRHFDFGP